MPTKERWAKMSDEEKSKYKIYTKLHQQQNREYWRELNRNNLQVIPAKLNLSKSNKEMIKYPT